MRIAVDAGTWFNGRGFGRFTRELITAMLQHQHNHEFVLLLDRDPPLGLDAESINVRPRHRVTEAAIADGQRSLTDMLRFTRAARGCRADVLFYPAIYSWFPTPPGLANLVTIHDAIPELFPKLMFPRRADRWRWRAKVRLAQWQATRFLTVSESARADLTNTLGIASDTIDVTTEGPNNCFRPPATAADAVRIRREVNTRLGLSVDTRFFCYVGGFAPHKNVPLIVRAFETMGPNDHHLLLVGDPDSHGFQSSLSELRSAIETCRSSRERIRFTGFLSDSDLAALYATADALVMPSMSEGFGLPAIEAMACGTPVIASNAASLPEVVGDAGYLLDPVDTAAFSAAMRRVAVDAPHLEVLRQRARQRATHFSWQKSAQLAFASLEKTLHIAHRSHSP